MLYLVFAMTEMRDDEIKTKMKVLDIVMMIHISVTFLFLHIIRADANSHARSTALCTYAQADSHFISASRGRRNTQYDYRAASRHIRNDDNRGRRHEKLYRNTQQL